MKIVLRICSDDHFTQDTYLLKDRIPGIRGLWGLELTCLVLQRQKKKKIQSHVLLSPTDSILLHEDRICSCLHGQTFSLTQLHHTHLAERIKGHGLLPTCCMKWQEHLFRFSFHFWKWSDQITAHNGAHSKKLQWDLEAFQSTYPNAYSSCFTVDEIINTEQQKLIPIWRILFS